MSKVSQFYSKQDIQEQACLWISRMDRGLSNTEKQALVVWINQNKIHHQTLLEMASYWDDLSVLNELSGLFPLERTTKKTVNRFTAVAMAASVALITLFSANLFINGTYLPFQTQPQLAQNKVYQTKIGEQASFSMPDGTNIQLNTNSLVKVAYSDARRQLTLVRGEARFDVAKDKMRPFTVTAGEQSFTALGTIFNIQKNDETTMELVVTEGRVLITKASETIEKITNTLTKLAPEQLPGVLVLSGEKAIIADNTPAPIKQVSLDQVQRDLAWQQGMLIFNGEPLAQALVEVSRYTATKFEIVDPQLANLKVAGYFKAGDVDGLLASLASNFNINFTISTNNTIQLTTKSTD